MQRTILTLVASVVVLATYVESEACCFRRRVCAPSYCQPQYFYERVPATPVALELSPVKSAKGKTYRVFNTFEGETTEHDRPTGTVTGAAAGGDIFGGSARKDAKTSISNGPLKSYTDIKALLADLPAGDDTMRAMDLRNKPRVMIEEKNVAVAAFIYAVKKEADNDFHVILGSDLDGNSVSFMTAEVSGLPEAGQFKAPLKKVRDKFKAEPALSHVNTSSYVKFNPPIPVTVTGSLFYDIDHPPGAIGPSTSRPKTAWEIHPVTEIDFEP